MKTFLKLFIVFFITFNVSFSENLYIKNTVVKNLPDQYGQIFSDFLLKNLENSYPYAYYNSTGFVVVPYISWIGISYNVCFDIYKDDYLVQMECFSPMSGEDIISDIYSLEKDLINFKFKKEKEKEIVLSFKIGAKPIVKRLKIISPKGDILVSYVPIIYDTSEENILDLGVGNLNLDTLILDYKQAEKVLKILLENFKVKEILIIK